MPKETQQVAPEPTQNPTVTADLTGLPVIEHDEFPDVPINGTVKEMLTLAKGKRKKEEKVDEKPKEKSTDVVDEKLKNFLFGRKPKPAAPKDGEPAPEVPDGDLETPPDPKPAKAKEPVKKKAVAKDHAADLAEKFADLERQRMELEKQRLEVERERIKAQTPAREIKPDAGLEILSEDERYELEVLQQMAKLDSSKYGDLPRKFTDLAKATAEYKAKWESENEGESFDPDDSAHDSFFQKNQIRYAKKDFKAAEMALVRPEQPKDESALKEIQSLKAKEKVREVMPRAIQVFAEGVESFLDQLDPEMAKSARDGGRDKLIEDFPDDADEVLRAASSIEAVSIEAHRILETDGLVEIDGSNKVHNLIVDIIRRKEPVTVGVRDSEGRPFATWSQWASMTDQQRAAHWHLGAAEIVDIVSQDLAASVRADLDRINSRVQNRLKGAAQAATTVKPKVSPVTSPSSANRATVDTSSKLRKDDQSSFQKTIRSALFKRAS